MALEDFTVNQNTAPVEQATGAMSLAQIDDIERRAKAQVTTVESESARAQTAEHEAAGKSAQGNQEAKLYGDVALEVAAPGLKMVSTAMDFIGQRHEDNAAGQVEADASSGRTEGISRNAVHVETDIAKANRPAGVYRSPAEQNAFGANTVTKAAATGASARARSADGEDLMANANIATTSLKDQHKEAVGSWDVKETKMAGVQLAKTLNFGQENSNDLALQSALNAKQQYSATMGVAQQMAPGMSMGMNGPSFRGGDIMKLAQEEADLNRWRTQQS